MIQFGLCPRCQSHLSEERLQQRPMVCECCGYSSSVNDVKADHQFESRFMKVAIFTAFVLVAGFLQTANWDRYALSIIPLKIKQFTGLADRDDLARIATICSVRFKHDCVETAYADLARQGDKEFFGELGKYQARRGNKASALKSLHTYIENGGTDLESTYQYAKLLGETGQVDRSAYFFDQILRAKADTLQISVTQSYVNMLMNNGRSAPALNLIRNVRKSSDTASLFMEEEFKKLVRVFAAAR